MAFRTENQIWSIIKGFIENALSGAGITDWVVMQNYQPTEGTYVRPHILMHKIAEGYIGHLQNPSFSTLGGGQLTQWTMQLDAIRARTQNDTTDTINGADVLQYIRFYLLSDAGLKDLHDNGFNVFFVSQQPEAQFKTEYDNYQLDPNLTLQFVFKQDYTQPTAAIRAVNPTLKGV